MTPPGLRDVCSLMSDFKAIGARLCNFATLPTFENIGIALDKEGYRTQFLSMSPSLVVFEKSAYAAPADEARAWMLLHLPVV